MASRKYMQKITSKESLEFLSPRDYEEARNFSKFQRLYRGGEIGISSSPRAKAKARNFSKSQSLYGGDRRVANRRSVFEGGRNSKFSWTQFEYCSDGIPNFLWPEFVHLFRTELSGSTPLLFPVRTELQCSPQSLFREGKVGIFPSPKAYIGGLVIVQNPQEK